MKYLCIWLIRFYQKVLSPLKRQPTCRFQPTCSQYAVEAFTKRGFFVGMILTVSLHRKMPIRSARGAMTPCPEKGLRRRVAVPMTKYYYPEEYHLERDEPEGEPTGKTGNNNRGTARGIRIGGATIPQNRREKNKTHEKENKYTAVAHRHPCGARSDARNGFDGLRIGQFGKQADGRRCRSGQLV